MRAILHRADGSLRASRENAEIERRGHEYRVLDLNIRKIRRAVDLQVYLDRIVAGLQQAKFDLVLFSGLDAGTLCRFQHSLTAVEAVQDRAVVVKVHLNAAVSPVDICRVESKIESVIPAGRPHVLVLEAVYRIKFYRRIVAAD